MCRLNRRGKGCECMNVLFFLKPKSESAYLYDDSSVRQGLEKMKYYGYSALPLIDREGKYTGTIREGDFLWHMLDKSQMEYKELEHVNVGDLPRRSDLKAVHINARIDELFELALDQNFVPVIDDNDVFIGIVTRKDIMNYYLRVLRQTES